MNLHSHYWILFLIFPLEFPRFSNVKIQKIQRLGFFGFFPYFNPNNLYVQTFILQYITIFLLKQKKIRSLFEDGMSVAEISKSTKTDYKTVQKYANVSPQPEVPHSYN